MRIRLKNQMNSGKRKGWTKHVTSVDNNKKNGFAFEGDFIPDDTEVDLPIGSILVQCTPEGSVKNGWKQGYILRVVEDGVELLERGYDWHKSFLSLRDKVSEYLNQGNENPLAEFSDEQLIQEIKDRGLQFEFIE